MKTGFNNKWKRRKDFSRSVWKFNIFLALYLGIYKKEFTVDNKWHFKTSTFLSKDQFNCVELYVTNHTPKEAKKEFKKVLIEEYNKVRKYYDKELLIGEVLTDFMFEVGSFKTVTDGIGSIGHTKKIIEALQKLEK